MLRLTRAPFARVYHESIVGADLPTFRRFPYKANEVLHLYRDFWRLILRYPENERHDLIFRLRNEFRSKRHMGHPKLVGRALARGVTLLDMYKSRIEFSESRPERRIVSRLGGSAVRKEKPLYEARLAAVMGSGGGHDSALSSSSSSSSLSSKSGSSAQPHRMSAKQRQRNNILGLHAEDIALDEAQSALAHAQSSHDKTTPIAMGGVASVNTIWEQIQQSTQSTLPNLRHYKHSKKTDGFVLPINNGVPSYMTSR